MHLVPQPGEQGAAFAVSRRTGSAPCTAGREKTFQLAGNRVYWGHRVEEQQAPRCVNGVQLAAATAMPPTEFADVGLGTLVASGREIR